MNIIKHEISPSIIRDVRIEDLQGDLRLVAETCGLDIAVELWKKCKGLTIVFSKSDLAKTEERYILENHQKKSVKHLAIEIETTQRHIYSILKKHNRVKNKEEKYV